MTAIIAITRNGLLLTERLKNVFPEAVVYTLKKFDKDGTSPIKGELSEFSGELFRRHKTLIFVMATGIVVRCIARWLTDKTNDPAVVVMDEKGQFAISLLSGHLGGANQIASQIAEELGATAVITTASDVQGIASVDMLAKTHGLIIHSMEEAKTVTALMVNGKQVALINDTSKSIPAIGFAETDNADGYILVTHAVPGKIKKATAHLLVKNLIVGIGCRKGVRGKKIIEFIEEQLKMLNIDKRCIKTIASVDIKEEEVGILEAAAHFTVPLKFVSRTEIEKVEANFPGSPFVKEQIGVSCVCEPAAYIAGELSGRFLLQKQAKDGITLAIFEENINN